MTAWSDDLYSMLPGPSVATSKSSDTMHTWCGWRLQCIKLITTVVLGLDGLGLEERHGASAAMTGAAQQGPRPVR